MDYSKPSTTERQLAVDSYLFQEDLPEVKKDIVRPQHQSSHANRTPKFISRLRSVDPRVLAALSLARGRRRSSLLLALRRTPLGSGRALRGPRARVCAHDDAPIHSGAPHEPFDTQKNELLMSGMNLRASEW